VYIEKKIGESWKYLAPCLDWRAKGPGSEKRDYIVDIGEEYHILLEASNGDLVEYLALHQNWRNLRPLKDHSLVDRAQYRVLNGDKVLAYIGSIKIEN
jgi:hypothetical protein